MKLSELKGATTEKCLNRSVAETINHEKEKTKKSFYSSFPLARLIPVHIPIDRWNVLRIVSDVEVRAAAVHFKNAFAFPNTKHSLGHVIG